jgi:sarcosine oxidase subunit alpha
VSQPPPAHDLRIPGLARPAPVAFSFAGRMLRAPAGESLAAALMAAGIRRLGESDDPARPRAAFCMMGVCQQCLVRVDGVLSQACLVPVREGMAVTTA